MFGHHKAVAHGLAPFRFIVSTVLCFSAGFLGSIFMGSSISGWYAQLNKPPFTPPGWMFGPVWIVLYGLMAAALLIVWNTGLRKESERMTFGLFFIHLFFNALWSIVLFGFHELGFAVLVMIVLWCLVYSLVIQIYKIDWFAGTLMIPYWAWLTFAGVLNVFLWLYNR